MFRIFRRYPDIVVAVSEKKHGAMKFSSKNRERFLEKLGIDHRLAVRADLVHGNNVSIVSNQDAGKVIEKTDGLITKDRNLFLSITVADCLPIFIYDPEKEIIGLVHGGWRSLAKNILAKTVKDLSEDTLVGIGPGISQCHYEVKKDVLAKFPAELERFKSYPLQKTHDRENSVVAKKDGKSFLDLKQIAKVQLINLGIKQENIEISPECTFCLSDKYFSFRRDRAQKIQTMLAVIGKR